MAKLIVLITARPEDGHRVAEAWQEAGAPGATLIEGFGLRRLQERARGMEVLPGMMSLAEILRQSESTSLIVLSVVEEDALIDRLLAATERILGDLGQPDAGVFFVVDLVGAWGVFNHRRPPRPLA
ncbi:MAG: hypothetical protein ACUVSX_11175 [Aggregatilineales bacterium]